MFQALLGLHLRRKELRDGGQRPRDGEGKRAVALASA